MTLFYYIIQSRIEFFLFQLLIASLCHLTKLYTVRAYRWVLRVRSGSAVQVRYRDNNIQITSAAQVSSWVQATDPDSPVIYTNREKPIHNKSNLTKKHELVYESIMTSSSHVEILKRENQTLKHLLDQSERENLKLKQSCFELSLKYVVT